VTLTDGVVQLLTGAVSGGGVGALASWLAARSKAHGEARRADTSLAAQVVKAEVERQRALWQRVEALESRCEGLEDHARRCEASLSESERVGRECEARYAALKAEMAELRALRRGLEETQGDEP
jgi:chromosome segregation ATPase